MFGMLLTLWSLPEELDAAQLQYALLDIKEGIHTTDKNKIKDTTKRHTGRTDLELVLLSVDDDCSDLLVHKDEDGAEQGRKCRHQHCPPGIFS